MSPRRRVFLAVVVVLALVVAVVVGVLVAGPGGRDAGFRPPQDVPGAVLLVPGYGGSTEALAPLADAIAATGRDVQVLTLPGDGTGDLAEQVRVLADAARATGAPSVDVVGYSTGGVVVALWIARDDGAAYARRVVTLGSPLNGTQLAGAGAVALPGSCPAACRQIAPGSAELADIAAAGVATQVPWLSIRTTDDQTVTPPDTARLPGAANVAVQDLCPGARVGHEGLPTDPTVTALVLGALGAGPIEPVTTCATP